MTNKLILPYKATVLVWGNSENTRSNGKVAALDKEVLFGGSVGHAAVELRLPLSMEETVKKYCRSKGTFRPEIPWEKVTDEDSGEEIILVRFSWIESTSSKYDLWDELSAEREYQRDAIEVNDSNPHNEKKFTKSGLLGRRIIQITEVASIDPKLDTSSLNEAQLDYLKHKILLYKLGNTEKTIKSLILQKFDGTAVKNGKQKITDSNKLLISNCLGITIQAKKKLLSEQEVQEIYDAAKEKLNAIIKQRKETKKALKKAKKDNSALSQLKKHIIVGKKEDSSISLPLTNLEGLDSGNLNGLDAVAMLKEMSKITKNEHFDENNMMFSLMTMNCSDAARRILTAGLPKDSNGKPNKLLYSIVNHKAWGFLSNPQLVFSSAVFLKEFMENGKVDLDLAQKLKYSDTFEVNRLTGYVIKNLLRAYEDVRDQLNNLQEENKMEGDNPSFDDERQGIKKTNTQASIKMKILLSAFAKPAVVALLCVPLIAVLAGAQKLADPTRFIKSCVGTIKYANATHSRIFTALTIAVCTPAIFAYSVPALLQQILKITNLALKSIKHKYRVCTKYEQKQAIKEQVRQDFVREEKKKLFQPNGFEIYDPEADDTIALKENSLTTNEGIVTANEEGTPEFDMDFFGFTATEFELSDGTTQDDDSVQASERDSCEDDKSKVEPKGDHSSDDSERASVASTRHLRLYHNSDSSDLINNSAKIDSKYGSVSPK